MAHDGTPDRVPPDQSVSVLAASLAPAVLDAIIEDSRAEAASILRERLSTALVEEVERLVASRYSPGRSPEVCDVRVGADSAVRPGAGWYVYGITWATAPLPVLQGVDGGCTQRVVVDDLAAVVSAIDGRSQWSLGPAGDLDSDLLAPRTREHARVLQTMLDNGAVLPLRFGVRYPGLTEVKGFLRENRAALEETLHRVEGQSEWGLVVAWDTTPDTECESESDHERDLVRHLQRGAVREDAERRARRAALSIHDELALIASDSVVHPIFTFRRNATGGRCPLLKASYLLPEEQADDFRRAEKSALARDGRDLGLTADLTGPWPPYSFSELLGDPVGNA